MSECKCRSVRPNVPGGFPTLEPQKARTSIQRLRGINVHDVRLLLSFWLITSACDESVFTI
jgi:hypothetical protein